MIAKDEMLKNKDFAKQYIAIVFILIYSWLLVPPSKANANELRGQTPSCNTNQCITVKEFAKEVTVKVIGQGSSGSGVIVQKNNNKYLVLTAWHVISETRFGEEIEIHANDGKIYYHKENSLQRIGDLDLGVFSFEATKSYKIAKIGNSKKMSLGNWIFISGFPLKTKKYTSLDGFVQFNTDVGIDQGYQLLYSARTLPGVSGGPIMDSKGFLIGIHGRGELDIAESKSTGFTMKTGINQGMPISYYKKFISKQSLDTNTVIPKTADYYLIKAVALGRQSDANIHEIKLLLDKSISLKPSYQALLTRAYIFGELSMYQNSIDDYNQLFKENSKSRYPIRGSILAYSHLNHGNMLRALNNNQAAISSFAMGIEACNEKTYYLYETCTDSAISHLFYQRGSSKFALKDFQGALDDFNYAINLIPGQAFTSIYLTERGKLYVEIGCFQCALTDYNLAIKLNPKDSHAWGLRAFLFLNNGERKLGCNNLFKSAQLGAQPSIKLINQGYCDSVLKLFSK